MECYLNVDKQRRNYVTNRRFNCHSRYRTLYCFCNEKKKQGPGYRRS